jgi:hypothetical protein
LSYATAKSGGFTGAVFKSSYFLADLFKSQGRTDSALFYLEMSFTARDSLFSQEKNQQLQNITFAEQVRQEELAQAEKTAEEERKDNLQMAGIAAFIPLFFALVMLLSKRRANRRALEFLGLVGVLMLFEFISLLIHPSIQKITHHKPVFMLLILVAIASVLVPLHHRMSGWVKERVVRRPETTMEAADVEAAEPAGEEETTAL